MYYLTITYLQMLVCYREESLGKFVKVKLKGNNDVLKKDVIVEIIPMFSEVELTLDQMNFSQ